MFDKLLYGIHGNAGMPFAFPVNPVVSNVTYTPAASDAHLVGWTWEEANLASHFYFEIGDAFSIVGGKHG
ncbi:MAG: hypothetical protein ACRD3Q_22170 [Terriglobales bacterium]